MTIKLTYFNARGRAEMSRMIAAYGKIDFKDVRVEGQDWPALKASKFQKFLLLLLMLQLLLLLLL